MYLVETEGDTGRDRTNSELKLIPFFAGPDMRYEGPPPDMSSFEDELKKGDDYIWESMGKK